MYTETETLKSWLDKLDSGATPESLLLEVNMAIILKCKNCGSTEIHRDAWAAIDPATGEWVLGDVYDQEVWCADCGEEGWSNIEEVEIDPTELETTQ